jgi:hypothetical protein
MLSPGYHERESKTVRVSLPGDQMELSLSTIILDRSNRLESILSTTAILLEKSNAYIKKYFTMSGATPCRITYQALYCLAFAYNDIVETVCQFLELWQMRPVNPSLRRENGPVMCGKGSAASGKEVENKVLAFKLKPTAGLSARPSVTICFTCPTLLPSARCHSTLLANKKKIG